MAVNLRMRRVERSARSLTDGDAILSFLKANRAAIIEGAKGGDPPVSAISEMLKAWGKRYGIAVNNMAVRQFVGAAIRALLEEDGFEVNERGVRLKDDALFTTASTYKLREETPPVQFDTVARFLDAMTDEEAAFALNRLGSRVLGRNGRS